ncbi:hypothetical protein [Legionella saoudiensis]|uniref:hypothetical protein n=1 Tax=Legionella saoudiensis TaxID=1750561 RepID=UPI00073066BA|nr:hypothetical protein [Legionella saoudiensis]
MSMNWNDVFGEVKEKKTPNIQISPHVELPMPNVQQVHEQLNHAIGQNLFDHIKRTQNLLNSHQIGSTGKKQLRETLEFFVNAVHRDMNLLEDTQSLLAMTKPILYRITTEQQQHFDKMLQLLDKAKSNYSAKLKKFHIHHAPFKMSDAVEKKLTADIHKKVIGLIQDGDLKNAVVMLLGFHYSYTQEQAASLVEAVKKIDLEHSEAFLELLTHRLYSKECVNPDRIEYSMLQNNLFLQDTSILPCPKNMLFFLNPTLEGLIQNKNAVCETKAKQQLIELVEEFNSFIDSIACSISSIEEKLRL